VEHILQENDKAFIKIPTSVPWSGEDEYVFSSSVKNDISAVMLDIATPYAFCDIEGVSAYLKILGTHCPVILLDGMWDNALSGKVSARLDMVVAPYFGLNVSSIVGENIGVHLVGPKYFIFGSEYEVVCMKKRNIRNHAERVLVTFGGSDPQFTTLKALDAISGITDRKLHVRVIVGPGFDPDVRKKIHQKTESLYHIVQVINSPSSLAAHMLWCDVAVVNSGLTKYELAVTGTPSLQISLNEEHAKVNQPFVETGAAFHLGVNKDVSLEYLRKEIVCLIEDNRRRCIMSEIGMNLLDTRGGARIVDAIKNLMRN